MMKYLTAALLAALTASPALAQMSGDTGNDAASGGAMQGDSSIQEEQIPDSQRAPGEGLDSQETQVPATSATGEPSETQIPDTQSDGAAGTPDQSDQGGNY